MILTGFMFSARNIVLTSEFDWSGVSSVSIILSPSSSSLECAVFSAVGGPVCSFVLDMAVSTGGGGMNGPAASIADGAAALGVDCAVALF